MVVEWVCVIVERACMVVERERTPHTGGTRGPMQRLIATAPHEVDQPHARSRGICIAFHEGGSGLAWLWNGCVWL